MALARHKAEGRCSGHWKRNHLFNSITESHSRLLCHWCHLESRERLFQAFDQTVLGHTVPRSSGPFQFHLKSQHENRSQMLLVMRWASFCPSCDEYTLYVVIEISFVTCFPFLIPGGWFGVIDQGFRHRINKAFTSPLARARGSVMAHYTVQLFSNGIQEPAQDY